MKRYINANLIIEESVDLLSFRRPIRVKQRVINERSEANIIIANAKKYVRTENLGGELYSTNFPSRSFIHDVSPTPCAIPNKAGNKLESASPRK
jgi:hypothetical protein